MKKRLSAFFLGLVFLSALSFAAKTEQEFQQVNADQSEYLDEHCDLVLDQGLCLYDGGKLILADARPDGIVGYWSFDDYRGLDSSGNHLHVDGPISFGPGYGGSGSSAVIGKGNFLVIPPSELFDNDEYSITFWVYISGGLDTGEGARLCPIIYKGAEVKYQNEKARSPAIYIDKKNRKVQAYFTTTANGTKSDGEFLESNGRISLQRWNHLALVRVEKKIYFYLNGMLDSIIVTEGSSVPNNAPLFVGNSPYYVEECDIQGFVDELRFYSRPLSENEIEAEASPALGNVHPDYVILGCVDCPANEARSACVDGYHLCTTVELHSAAYQVAKINGWADWNSRIWSFQSVKDALPDELGIGICCVN